jgi:hypothetical protein
MKGKERKERITPKDFIVGNPERSSPLFIVLWFYKDFIVETLKGAVPFYYSLCYFSFFFFPFFFLLDLAKEEKRTRRKRKKRKELTPKILL